MNTSQGIKRITRKSTQMRDLIDRFLNDEELNEFEQRVIVSPDVIQFVNQIREFRKVQQRIENDYQRLKSV